MKKKSDNKNIKKTLLKIVINLILVVVSIPVALTLLFQNPSVQTISARIATNLISQNLDQNIKINSIKLGIFSGINIRGLKVLDHHNEILLGVGKLRAMPVLTGFNLLNIKFASIEIDSAEFRMGSYKNEESSNLAMLLQSFASKDTSNTVKSSARFSMSSNSVILKNSIFNLFNENRDYGTGSKSMDYANILITDINTTIRKFYLINDSLNLKIKELSANENSGIEIKKMSTDFIISSSGMVVQNALIDINNSNLDVDFKMEYNTYNTLSYYIDSVNMIGSVRPTIIDMADIGHFAEVLYQMPNKIGITGNFNGTVNKLTGTDLRVKYGENTRLSGDINIAGLPDFYSSHFIAKDLMLTSNVSDVKSFYLPIESKFIDLSNMLPAEDQVTIVADFDGYYENFKSKAKIALNDQVITSSIDFKTKNKITNFTASLKTDSLNVGEILSLSNYIGSSGFDLKINGVGKSLETMKYSASGKLKNSQILNYNYSRIGFSGSYFGDSIIADLRVGDKNLMMETSAKAYIGHTPEFKINSNIVKANLNDLNLWLNQDIQISTKIKADIVGTDINTLNANIALRNTSIKFTDNEYNIDSILIVKETSSQNFTTTSISSEILEAEAIGTYYLTTVTNSVLNLFDSFFDIVSEENEQVNNENSVVDINIIVHEPDIFTNQIFKGLSVSPETSLIGKINFKTKNISAKVSSNKILINDIRLDSNILNIYTDSNYIFSEFSIANLILKDSTPEDSIVLGIDNFSLSSRIGNDSLTYGINWYNRNLIIRNTGELEGYIAKNVDTSLFNIGKAEVFINDIKWSIDTSNKITLYDSKAHFENFFVTAGKSQFKLLGTIPRAEPDSLVAEFVDWDLSNFDLLTLPLNFQLDGKINGRLKLSMIQDNPTLVSNINIRQLTLNDEYLGDASIINSWDNNAKSIFIKSQIIRHGNVGSGEIFHAEGYYHPFESDENLKIDVSFDKFKLSTFEPFLFSFVNEMEGTTSGELAVRGSVKKPVVTGYADMQRTSLRVVYLNTKYSFSNSIEFVKNGLQFDKLVIYDTLGNQAQINGRLTHNYFADPEFNIDITTDGLLFFNTSEHMNDLYYGSAIASGKLNVSGTPEDVNLSINVKTQRGTSVILPLNYSVEISDKDYIIFTQKNVDTISENKLLEITAERKADQLNYNINVNLEVTPIAEVGIKLPDDMGNITARGSSNLALEVNSNGKFTLVGDYIVDNGIFLFKIGNLVSKRFELVSGGRISWSGNPYSAQLNIRGLYKVKTNLSSLGITRDSTASYKNKVTVECYVVLTDELLNPNIKFEIKIPSLDPDYQRAVFSELDTTNTAMMNQQMISLLVLGTFSFNNAANVSLQSSYYNVIANQLSSMLSQISENVDVGLNYKPGDNVSQEEFEVALSTQLFDDRLTIDGNFGMTYDRSDQSASNIVGDVDIGYKLRPDGQWVLKVFNHSNVNSWYNYNNYDQTSPYTQGVGIAFRKDFNNISGLFKSKKKKGNKKNENIPEIPDTGNAVKSEEN